VQSRLVDAASTLEYRLEHSLGPDWLHPYRGPTP
jgi:hypothetical protein